MTKKQQNIDLPKKHYKTVKDLLETYLPNTEVWAYGSRVKGTSRPLSDLDLVAFAGKDQQKALATLKEAFEESNLPFRVDLFAWDDIPKSFHKQIKEDHIVLQDPMQRSIQQT